MAESSALSRESSSTGGEDHESRADDRKSTGRLAAGMRRASMMLSRVRSERLARSDSGRISSSQSPQLSVRDLEKAAKEAAVPTPPTSSNHPPPPLNTSQPSSPARRTLVKSENSSRFFGGSSDPPTPPAAPHDDEQKAFPALSKLPAAGFNRLKTMWANRETSYGFSNPLSTWSRPYGNHKKDGENGASAVKVSFDPKSKAYSGRFNPDQTDEKYKQFGCAIQDCPRTKMPPYKEALPSVLLFLKDELQKNDGYLVEGVFRVAASFEDQKTFKKQVDEGTFQGCKTQDDAMCMAALLKEWFRTMPVRLLNSLPLTSIRAGKSDYMKELPEPNLSVFLWLCDMMAEIVLLEQVNRMNTRAMAIVIAPNLYSPGDNATQQEIIQETNGAVSIVETALREALERRQPPKQTESAAV